jgi:hypothetical protein
LMVGTTAQLWGDQRAGHLYVVTPSSHSDAPPRLLISLEFEAA